MIDVKIVDSGFAHTMYGNYSLSRPNKYFNWLRNFDKNALTPNDIVFFTDLSIFQAHTYPNCRKIAWLIEPPEYQPVTYAHVEQNMSMFEKVLTYEKALLDKNQKYVYYTAGGCWISERDMGVWPKTKLVSTIMSNKQTSQHHQFRYLLKNSGVLNNVDIYGRGGNIPIPGDSDKAIASKDYAFHIVVDQSVQEYGFTEKIIDCFATGSVPIYRGTRDVCRYFNKDGIIYFYTLDDLRTILSQLSFEKYQQMLEAVVENYNKCFDFLVPEDLLYTNFISKLF